jgi:glycosyltransferase involved in cell wall biosynthesis
MAMNIAFVCHTNFSGNSGIQLFHLANKLADKGCGCVCVVPDEKQTVVHCGTPKFGVYNAVEALSDTLAFPDGGPPSLIHAWTPREHVRSISEHLAHRYACPIVVHLEDNEDLLTASRLGLTVAEMNRLTNEELDRRLPHYVSHPQRSRAFMAGAIGVTALVDRLREFAPADTPVQVFSPSCDPSLFHPMMPDHEVRAQLGIDEDEIVLTYNGNVHQANKAEVRSLYLSVLFLNRMGHPARLIRLGSGIDCLGNARSVMAPYVIDLGVRPNREMPRFLALATALVQPGSSGPFNDYRFPSKIPEFLAMGLPVIMPRSNVGLEMSHGENCLLLQTGHAGEIVDLLLTLKANPGFAKKVAMGGRRFFEENLSWDQAANKLLDFYRSLF